MGGTMRPSLALRAAAVAAAFAALTAARPAPVLDDGLARTPPMGWNSWNRFACNVSEELVRGIADAMVASGMREVGYRYVVIDDCWQVARDSATGRIVPDPQRFPSGMRALADYVHARGLRFGLYTDAGRRTCEGRPGSYGFEDVDMRTYAEWGVDYVKVDWCHSEGLNARERYAVVRDAIRRAGRPIVLSICEWGSNRPWEWGDTTGHLWRTTGDISDRWSSMVRIADLNQALAPYARPGAWNDPDMLEVGNGGMSADEYRVHMALWAIMAAPLIAGNDLRAMSEETRAILTNPEVIAVDQDTLGAQGWMVAQPRPLLQVWMKPLGDGARAVALVNRTEQDAAITADWASIALRGPQPVRDLWARADRGTHRDRFTATVPRHGVVLVTVGRRTPRVP
jgi:alpha-galactosidase